MLIKINTDSFVESNKIDQYYLDGKNMKKYILLKVLLKMFLAE